ncbi:nucleoside deaminase [Kocuria palustris]|uniref:nucleoside deaminase n=1 Tax=Kocuria palustris TaxID=71999 RepID=UPI00119E9FBE|nr:nucleoside deaminase [Kocuria palustris]
MPQSPDPDPRTEREHLAAAVRLAAQAVADGGGPFGAVVVTAGGDRYSAVNDVTRTCDPTAHAEIGAIRAACAGEGVFALHGAVLYSSCRPCPMCFTACQWARLERVVYAATDEQAAAAGFDDSLLHRAVRLEAQPPTPVDPASPEALAGIDPDLPFELWRASDTRVDY